MLLHQIKLNNIRSYMEETISFHQGATLLSGDIGAGKSTILHAIEFAFFGVSRTELPAEALLRKGAVQGSVELTFSLPGKEIIIQRQLKKEKETIKQTTGSIIINNVKKDLTPIELKAEMLSLLGYPEEYLNKTNNYIYRYTVYTPQEEMKLILQEAAEIRLDTLRKIFNVDKYKHIRENLQIYLRQLRLNIAVRKTKAEQLEERKQYLRLLEGEEQAAQAALQELTPALESVRGMVTEAAALLSRQEQEQREFLELQQRQRMLLAILAEKNRRLCELEEQEVQNRKKLHEIAIPAEYGKEEVLQKVQLLEEQRKSCIQIQSSLQERLRQLQQEIVQVRQRIALLGEQTAVLEEKEKLVFLLSEEGKEKKAVGEKRVQLDELFLKTQGLITRNETVLQQSREIQAKMSSLDTCPTCLQQVKEEYKHAILNQEEQKIKQAENLLFELHKKKSLILQQREEVLRKSEILHQKEVLCSKTWVEVLQLREKKSMQEELKKSLPELEEEYARVGAEVQQSLISSPLEKIEREIVQWREIVGLFSQQAQWQQQIVLFQEQIKNSRQQSDDLNAQLGMVQTSLLLRHDLSDAIATQQRLLQQRREEEKIREVEEAQWKAKQEMLMESRHDAQSKVLELEQEKKMLAKEQQLQHWLEEYFTPLTIAIEKQVMVHIHHLFNGLFQEWFSILIDNEGIMARIDDSFSPVIEQNGYEIAFVNLSGGEKTSASLAYRLALNRVINDVIHDIKTKDLLILDEPTDGFSSEQLDKVREVLDRLELQQTIIVSHESKIESFVENVIRITKEGNASKTM